MLSAAGILASGATGVSLKPPSANCLTDAGVPCLQKTLMLYAWAAGRQHKGKQNSNRQADLAWEDLRAGACPGRRPSCARGPRCSLSACHDQCAGRLCDGLRFEWCRPVCCRSWGRLSGRWCGGWLRKCGRSWSGRYQGLRQPLRNA